MVILSRLHYLQHIQLRRLGSSLRPPPFGMKPLLRTVVGTTGICLMRNAWKEDQHPSFINFISTFLSANSFRLNFVPIAPDFIFNCGGLSVAFIFVSNWDCNNVAPIFNRVKELKMQFARFYVVIALPAKEQMNSFIQSYFTFGMVIGKPTFVPVQDLEMGFEKMVKIAHSSGVYKQERIGEKLKEEVSWLILHSYTVIVLGVPSEMKNNIDVRILIWILKRKQLVQRMDFYLKVVTSIPGIDNHDANALSQAIGSVQAIAKASKEQILENTDLSTNKAEVVSRFLRDPKFYSRPKIN
ncbi:unnamed protein product [Sphenostylis stenocarpa]|uniref:Uncharacterized protein n=1 Tax=Sphenostylis stenocarpa TaxID=92480 RepID=A0AA86V5S6_9FABA|nr:unnamed protein product [Sphenostylis stenocarpa]